MARRPLVLWAEDNLQDQILIRAALEDLGQPPEVRFADDGVLLLAALKAQRPDLVVLDLKMPRLGGLDVLRRIRGTPALASLPVTIFSAGDDPAETNACLDLGALEVVRKPVDFREFTTSVQSVVARAATVP